MKTVISMTYCQEIEVSVDDDGDIHLIQGEDHVVLDQKQAKELIAILSKFMEDGNDYTVRSL
ncbi:MAG: hypothetical protein KBT03_00150 [Bacteroidales bacterium]|nr:hypothetical protein [Candidatus Scybalousia scybalohippi]